MKEFDLIIKNGTVVTSTESFLCDVAVKDGKIAAMAQNIEADAKEIYDAAGKLVLPGALDAHTHMAMPLDRKSTRLNSSHIEESRMPSSA